MTFLEARIPSEVFLDLPKEAPSTQEHPWSDLEISQNKHKRRPDELKKILNFGSKTCKMLYEAPRIAQIGSLARRKKSFLAIRDGGRVVRFLGLPQAVSCLDDQNVGFPPLYSLHFPGGSRCLLRCS
jgi:hypothetical protein